MCCFLDNLRKCLLACGNDPNLALSEFLEVAGQPVEIENAVPTWRHILASFVNEKEDVLLARLASHQLDDSPCSIAEVRRLFKLETAETFWGRKFLELQRRKNLSSTRHTYQGVIVNLFPAVAELVSIQLLKPFSEPTRFQREFQFS